MVEKSKIGSYWFPDDYEGFLIPRSGATPYKIIDDPDVIRRKAEMREALREEYARKLYNPYIRASAIGGTINESAHIRYEIMHKTFHEYSRPGPRFAALAIIIFALVPYAYHKRREQQMEHIYMRLRKGTVAYADRHNKFMY